MKRYTAQEMRIWAGQIEFDGPVKCGLDACRIAAMLRQAADDMERERRYEYAARYSDGHIPAFHYRSMDDVLDGEGPFADEEFVVVRRQVGEWEEVGE